MVQWSFWLQVHSSYFLGSCSWISVPVTFSPSGDRKVPSLSYLEPVFNKAAKISQLELLFHKDLLGGADVKNGGYVAKKITLDARASSHSKTPALSNVFLFQVQACCWNLDGTSKWDSERAASGFHWHQILALLPCSTVKQTSMFPHHHLWEACSTPLGNPGPNLPGEQTPQCNSETKILYGLSYLVLISKSSGWHTHRKWHLVLQEFRTNSLNSASSGQANQHPHPHQATHVVKGQPRPPPPPVSKQLGSGCLSSIPGGRSGWPVTLANLKAIIVTLFWVQDQWFSVGWGWNGVGVGVG